MADDHPWEEYAKDRPLPGFTYPVGREIVERALMAAGARVGALYFSRPKVNPPNNPPIVIRIHWPGTGRPGYFDAKDSAKSPFLIMWVQAVLSDDRAAIRAQLEAGALSRACDWVAALRSSADTPAAIAERELYVTWSGAALTESPTWPPRDMNSTPSPFQV